jgi:catechol 2,3-dioxygenase-like lactoylglutathione lyase family enzyme
MTCQDEEMVAGGRVAGLSLWPLVRFVAITVAMGGQVVLGLTRIRHAKLPVTDLPRSVVWYQALLGLELAAEFAEQGVVRGVQLMDPAGGFGVALREREFCASRPVLTGFDVFAVEAESVTVLRQLAERCDELGVAHGGVQDRGRYGASLDIPDPDGTVLRFLANNPINEGHFLGVDVDRDGQPTVYATSKLIG